VATCTRNIVITLMLYASTFSAKISAKPKSPNLLAQYDDRLLKPNLPAPELTFITTPLTFLQSYKEELPLQKEKHPSN
jgi:hypothetical protein